MSFSERAGHLWKRTKSRPLTPSEVQSVSDMNGLDMSVYSVVPSFEAVVVSFSSPEYQQARQLQLERYTRACKPGPNTYQLYQEIVDAASQNTLPLAVLRRASSPPDSLVGTARLELPGATTIESIVRFKSDSPAASVLTRRSFAEIGVFATHPDLPWEDILDVIDTVANAVIKLAQEQHLECLWIFPRLTMISLLLAEIPELLPAYHFTLCPDVEGWNETSIVLKKIRTLGMKELPVSPDTLPLLIQISPEVWAADLQARLSLREQRRQHPEMPRLLRMAMRQAYQKLLEQRTDLRSWKGKENRSVKQGKSDGEPVAATAPLSVESATPPSTTTTEQGKQGFLPFGASQDDESMYLRQIVDMGGEAATSYKKVSYDLLSLKPGMQVLDVGCGIGMDLPALADAVGAEGIVVGLDHDQSRIQTAKESLGARNNIRLLQAEAQQLPLPSNSFDGVRADRVLQHIVEAGAALGEMGRVLRPGGIVSLVDVDWRGIVLFPASPQGGNNDHTWSAIVQLCQRRLPNALIGRQLRALLQGKGRWEGVSSQVIAYTFYSWQVANTLLQISNLAQALIADEPSLSAEVNDWLQAVEEASQRGEFLASVPLFFASARKAETK